MFDSKDVLIYKRDLKHLVRWEKFGKSEGDEKPIVLFKMNLKYNFKIGSSDSLDFHIALSKVKEVKVF